MSKVCKYCGEINPDDAARCLVCEMAFPKESDAEAAQWYVICPCCGKRFPARGETDRVMECDNCGDEMDRIEIARVVPVKVTVGREPACRQTEKTSGTPVLVLTELRKKKRIEIDREVIIDREASDIEPEFFREDRFVSSPHCRITCEGGEWKIEDMGSLNKTAVNKVEIPPFFPTNIHDGNYIRIADLLFQAGIRPAQTEPMKTEVPRSENKVWAIRCHICGTYYEVDGPEARLSECRGPCRDDEFDRFEIAEDMPQRVDAAKIEKRWRKA